MTPRCYREASIIVTLSNDTGSRRLFTQGTQAHQAWHISWEASDTSKLTPSLPQLTSNKHIPTWKPGEIIEKGLYGQGDRGRYGYLAGLIAWCYISNRRSTREYGVKQTAVAQK
ncbi:hypothetical protein VE04_06180 [Pseudogymnoascus sp. 24MN13]|nr:hypothetical protein VE04_06180 [Pseudogymnoascus sp. 24MN13]